ncbi:uncharacterized protein [Macrobrachium rosenbergii]|uniref:uncharacterized protein n=1 Tax=Macrobrachium rosenbergii TaxID=79674 RepID=UPI0034D41628
MFPITAEIKEDLRWWTSRDRLSEGKSLHLLSPDLSFYADALDQDWGPLLGTLETSSTWSPEQRRLHINVRESSAIHLGLKHFVKLATDRTMVVHSDNTTALSCIRKQGGTHSFSLNEAAKELFILVDQNQVRITTRFIQGRVNPLADEPS